MTHELRDRLLRVVQAPGYQPVKPRVLANLLDVQHHDLRDLKKLIKKLIKRGQLSADQKNLIGPAQPTADDQRHVTGVFRRTQSGFGFVRPSGTAPGADRKLDIYISAKNAGDASTGDTVLVRLQRKRHSTRPNPEGEIVRVVERDTHRFVGAYFEEAGQAFVRVDGTVFARPVLVGDPGAKNAQLDDKVVIEMVRFPTHFHDGEGVVVEILGARGLPGVDTLSIIHEFNLPQEFPADCLEEARAETERFDESVPPGRVDLSGETIITIDPVDARDFDDAISLVRTEQGHWRLGVHIADVTHFVRPGTALDREARQRATSVYLPDRVLPMLPEAISNGLASLQPNKVRYAKTCWIEFTAEGIRTDVQLATTAICSSRRFTYEEVDDYLAHRRVWQSKLTPEVHALLGRMHELAMILRRRRMERGSLELSMREVRIDLNKQGEVSGAHLVQNTESHQIIEEFMLAANEAVADDLARRDMLFLRRIHLAPDPRKLKQLTEFVKELGLPVESLVDRFELQQLLNAVVGRPEQQAVHYAVLRSLTQAVYSPLEEGHFALASKCYCHFTSPIRRYPDLTVHRLVDSVLSGHAPRGHNEELAVLGEHCSDRERRAEQAERELTKVKLLTYLSQHVGDELNAVITGVEDFGLFAQGVDLPAEGLIHISSLQDDFYRYEKASHSLVGHRQGNSFRLGDPLRVVVARVDVDRRELDFRLAGRAARGPRPPARVSVFAGPVQGRKKKPRPTQKESGVKGRRHGGSKKPGGRKGGKRRK